MRKAAPIAVLILVLMLFSSGCSSFLDGHYSYATPHTEPDTQKYEHDIVQVSTYNELKAAILDLVEKSQLTGLLRFSNYAGDVEVDVADACMYICNNTPLGAYAVYYINSSVNKYVTYYEAELDITYKKSPSEISGIVDIENADSMYELLDKSLTSRKNYLAVNSSSVLINDELILRDLDEIYYSDPSNCVVWPDITLSIWPESGVSHIYELSFKYPYPETRMNAMEVLINSAASDLTGDLEDSSDYDACLTLCQRLSAEVKFDAQSAENDQYNRSDSQYTAYGALVEGQAAGEGFAMAYKLLCDKLDIDCRVVIGRFDGVAHAWNAVNIGGRWHHVDSSKYSSLGQSVCLRTSGDMPGDYWWDSSLYSYLN
ncbi:MAG: hypothetical protein IJG63_09370 [Oscillospiraceae bacterium]|nr:hypothetical protein [Oscillospiraceae bacterium]